MSPHRRSIQDTIHAALVAMVPGSVRSASGSAVRSERVGHDSTISFGCGTGYGCRVCLLVSLHIPLIQCCRRQQWLCAFSSSAQDLDLSYIPRPGRRHVYVMQTLSVRPTRSASWLIRLPDLAAHLGHSTARNKTPNRTGRTEPNRSILEPAGIEPNRFLPDSTSGSGPVDRLVG